MHARLTVLSGAKTKQLTVQLPTIIGRGNDAKLKLPSATVSRQHCEIYSYEGQIAVRDLGSSNGTLVNGHRIEGPTFVTEVDDVKVGPVKFQLGTIDNADVQKTSQHCDPSEQQTRPDLGNIPAATTEPSDAMEAGLQEATTETDAQDSVLQYVAPSNKGTRSFLGVLPSSELPEVEEDAAEISATIESTDSVANDDSSLQDFFNNMGG